MATYKFGKYESWDSYEYFAIHKKTFFGGWSQEKTWGLSTFGTHTKEYEDKQRKAMMESVDRLVKAGHTVL
jgi:hypothetical protein